MAQFGPLRGKAEAVIEAINEMAGAMVSAGVNVRALALEMDDSDFRLLWSLHPDYNKRLFGGPYQVSDKPAPSWMQVATPYGMITVKRRVTDD